MKQALTDLAVAQEGDGREEGTSSRPDVSVSTVEPVVKTRGRDEKNVARSRTLLMMVLLTTAVVIAALVYKNVSGNEQGEFETQFETRARQITHMAHKNVKTFYLSIESMSILFPSAAHHSGETLPFVTVPDFEAFGETARTLSKASLIAYTPFLQSQQDLEEWNAYSTNHSNWIEEGRSLDSAIVNIQESRKNRATQGLQYKELDAEGNRINTLVYQVSPGTGRMVPAMGDGPFAPLWEMTPVPNDTSVINFDLASHPGFAALLSYSHKSAKPILSEPMAMNELFRHFEVDTPQSPVSILLQPVFDGFKHGTEHRFVGALTAVIPWVDFYANILSEGQRDMLVVADSCGVNNTFLIHGAEAEFFGSGDLHDRKYSSMGKRSIFVEFDSGNEFAHCHHVLYVFPTNALWDEYVTMEPVYYAAFVLALFLGTGAMFLVYDWFVSSRQNHTEQKADKANAIVHELFPDDVATQLFDAEQGAAVEENTFKVGTIARLHPAATVLFADIAGFTAWSSMRDPHQVFTLLETIFQAFDVLAKRNGVYKVETVGDCYVDLGMRIGIHSGPVTAGVLRGDRARFQLFGDTVNTASRMESSGQKGRIHLSEQTAMELTKHGKESWAVQRDDVIEAKGKGQLTTFWFKHKMESICASSATETSAFSDTDAFHEVLLTERKVAAKVLRREKSQTFSKMQRIIDWNSDLLRQLLIPIVARRYEMSGQSASKDATAATAVVARQMGLCTMVVDEVAEVIEMPHFVRLEGASNVELENEVFQQLRCFVAKIASMYNDNPFHNFEHASHVAMSVHKLLTRIVDPHVDDQECTGTNPDQHLHDHTYGIKSDPMTQFTVVLAALIHDVDHPGVSNTQLVKEQPSLGQLYQDRSVAEQISVNLAWNALLSPEFAALRHAIFATEAELCRFRQLLVNAVIATDIFDKELGAMRKNRWNKAFDKDLVSSTSGTSRVDQNRKATIVIEHLIQASDIAHTMQHWHVYLKWNQCLFNETLRAYRDGRSDTDPAEGWYDGELGFFDFYIIPLAKKLRECGVFGVSSDECLTYALQNRSEWANKGKDTVEKYIVEYQEAVSGGARVDKE